MARFFKVKAEWINLDHVSAVRLYEVPPGSPPKCEVVLAGRAGEAPHLVFEGADAERVLEILEANKL